MIEYKIIAEEENKRLGLFRKDIYTGKFKFTGYCLTNGSLYFSIINYINLSECLPLTNLREYEVVRNFPFGPNGETGDDYIKKDINLNLLSSRYRFTDEKLIYKLVDWEKLIFDSNEIFFNPDKPKKYYYGCFIRNTDYSISFLLDNRELISLDKAVEEGYVLPECPKKILENQDLDEINLPNYINPNCNIFMLEEVIDVQSISIATKYNGKNIALDEIDQVLNSYISIAKWERDLDYFRNLKL